MVISPLAADATAAGWQHLWVNQFSLVHPLRAFVGSRSYAVCNMKLDDRGLPKSKAVSHPVSFHLERGEGVQKIVVYKHISLLHHLFAFVWGSLLIVIKSFWGFHVNLQSIPHFFFEGMPCFPSPPKTARRADVRPMATSPGRKKAAGCPGFDGEDPFELSNSGVPAHPNSSFWVNE